MPGTKALSLFRLGYPSLLRTMGGLMSFVGIQGPFSPGNVAGLQLWLDASNAATLFQDSNGTTPATADGDPVGYWGDRSGNGGNVTQSTSTKRGTLKLAVQNGLPVIRFDGTDDVLQSASGVLGTQTAVHVFAVGKYRANADNKAFLGASSTANAYGAGGYWWLIRQLGATPANSVTLRGAVPNATTDDGTADTSAHVFELSWQSGNALVNTVDGVAVSGSSVTASLTLTGSVDVGDIVGGGLASQLDAMEILVYNTTLSTASQSAVETYLKNKWGTP